MTGPAGNDKVYKVKIPARVWLKCTPGSPLAQLGVLFYEFVKMGPTWRKWAKAGWDLRVTTHSLAFSLCFLVLSHIVPPPWTLPCLLWLDGVKTNPSFLELLLPGKWSQWREKGRIQSAAVKSGSCSSSPSMSISFTIGPFPFPPLLTVRLKALN